MCRFSCFLSSVWLSVVIRFQCIASGKSGKSAKFANKCVCVFLSLMRTQPGHRAKVPGAYVLMKELPPNPLLCVSLSGSCPQLFGFSLSNVKRLLKSSCF